VLSHNNRLALHQQTARLQHEQRSGDWTVRASAADTRGGPDRREHLSLGAAASYPARDFGFAERALGLEVQRRFGERHSLVAGADHSHDTEQRMRIYSVDAASGARTLVSGGGADAHFNNLGYYLQYRLQPWSWLGVTANVRRDRHSVFGSDQNYRLALVGNATPSLSYKLLHGTSYKAPSAAQLYAQPLYAGDVLGNLALRPETSASSEASVAWQATPELALSANAYKLTVRDLTELLPLGGNVQPQNSGRQRGHGWEGEAYWQFGAQRLRAQEGVLGAEVRQPPDLRRHYAKAAAVGQRRTVGQHQLHMMLGGRAQHLAAPGRQRMARRHHRHRRHAEQIFRRARRRHVRQRTDHRDPAALVQQRLQYRAQRFDIQPQRGAGKRLLKGLHRRRQRGDREHHIHHHRQFRLQALGQGARLGLEGVHAADGAARLLQ
jgi:hypothetical protein